MRVGLISPYSYTYPGGVGGHVEALAHEFAGAGHEVRLLAPYDPDDRHARMAHRGASPARRPVPDWLVPLGRSVSIPANGAVSNLAVSPAAVAVLRRELRNGAFDVLHVHEPNAPFVSWCAVEAARVPLVGTFHAYSTNGLTNSAACLLGARRLYNKLHNRIAVSEAARWTAERFYGGRYRVIPNGVDLVHAADPAEKGAGSEPRLLFVGRAEERKGLPVLLRAFEALRGAGIAARLTVAGATAEEVEPLLIDREGIEVAGRVDEEGKRRLMREADLVCAPSLGGESFGMVLTEAFASATPVVCSDIAGYRDVVRQGIEGLLVPPGRPAELARALRDLALDSPRRVRMAAAARQRAERFAWPRVASEILAVYEEAIAAPAPESRFARAALRTGLRPADPRGRRPPQRLASMEPVAPGARRRGAARAARRVGLAAGSAGALLLAILALDRIGADTILGALLAAAPVWVLASLGLMGASLLLRSEAWHAVLRAAVADTRVRRRDTARATMIGVLMSATLPARLGEPSRALILARRIGRVRERLPIVLGTLVSQTLLNVLALAVLGVVMLATAGLFRGREGALAVVTIAPLLLLAIVACGPALLRDGGSSRWQRAREALGLAGDALTRVRSGLRVFRRPAVGARAAAAQLCAWALQWLACYALLVALGLDERAGLAGAAAVLFAVNVTAVLPLTPSNLGVFQAACVAVLSAYGVGHTDALAYGIILQAVEIATAVAMGGPALVREGMTWRDMRLRALHASPVDLGVARPGDPAEAEA